MKFVPQTGTFQARVFNNSNIDYPPTLFYDLHIPVELFDTGLAYESEPVQTAFDLDFLLLPIPDWRTLDGQTFVFDEKHTDSSIDLGGFPNPVRVKRLSFSRIYDVLFRVDYSLFCDFETRNVRPSEAVETTSEVIFTGLYLNFDQSIPQSDYRPILMRLIEPTAYQIGSRQLINRMHIAPR